MTETRIGVLLAQDGKSVAVEIGPVGGPSAPVQLNFEQLGKLIALLGQARRLMAGTLPKRSLEGQTVETVVDPTWYVQVADIDGSLLAFDHPAYGALGFAIPRNDVVKIVRTLNEHLALPASPSDKPS